MHLRAVAGPFPEGGDLFRLISIEIPPPARTAFDQPRACKRENNPQIFTEVMTTWLIRSSLARPRGLLLRPERKSIRGDQLHPAATRDSTDRALRAPFLLTVFAGGWFWPGAVELAATYPQTVATLLDLLARVADCERECSRIASMAPAGERRRLLGPELHAKGPLGSRVTRRRSPGICACRTGSSPAEQRGRRSERARWRHVSIHTAIGTPPTGGEREHETLVKACGTRLGVSLSVRRRNPITYWQA